MISFWIKIVSVTMLLLQSVFCMPYHQSSLMTALSDSSSRIRSAVNMKTFNAPLKTDNRSNRNFNHHVNNNKVQVKSRKSRSASIESIPSETYYPTIMAEMIPAALVSRHPSVITLRADCPAGYHKDYRGVCRKIVKYTVNFGSKFNPQPTFHRSPYTSSMSDFLWTPKGNLFNRKPKFIKSPPTLRDLAKGIFSEPSKIENLKDNNKGSSSSGENTDSKNSPLTTLEQIQKLLRSYTSTTPPTTTIDHDD